MQASKMSWGQVADLANASRFKYIAGGSLHKGSNTYDNLQIPDAIIDGNMIVANDKYVAMPWKSGGGAVHVRTVENFGNLGIANVPQLAGHTGVIQDVCFS